MSILRCDDRLWLFLVSCLYDKFWKCQTSKCTSLILSPFDEISKNLFLEGALTYKLAKFQVRPSVLSSVLMDLSIRASYSIHICIDKDIKCPTFRVLFDMGKPKALWPNSKEPGVHPAQLRYTNINCLKFLSSTYTFWVEVFLNKNSVFLLYYRIYRTCFNVQLYRIYFG